MGWIRKLHYHGGSLVVAIPPPLGYHKGDWVEVEEAEEGISFSVTRVAKMSAKERDNG